MRPVGTRLPGVGLLWVCLFGLASGGCASAPVLTADEAVPRRFDELDEATELISRRHLSNFKLCVQRSKLVDDAALVGQPMDLIFTINPEGQAMYVKVHSPEFKGSAFASCIERILTWIRFPAPGDRSRQLRLRLWVDEEAPVRAR